MPFKFLFAALLLFFASCTNLNIYVRYTDMHHVKNSEIEILEIDNDSIIIRDLNASKNDQPSSDLKISLSDSNFSFIEGKKVIKYMDNYYIKKSVKNKRILYKYYNHDIEF